MHSILNKTKRNKTNKLKQKKCTFRSLLFMMFDQHVHFELFHRISVTANLSINLLCLIKPRQMRAYQPTLFAYNNYCLLWLIRILLFLIVLTHSINYKITPLIDIFYIITFPISPLIHIIYFGTQFFFSFCQMNK